MFDKQIFLRSWPFSWFIQFNLRSVVPIKYHSRSEGPSVVHVKIFRLPGNLSQTVLSSKKMKIGPLNGITDKMTIDHEFR